MECCTVEDDDVDVVSEEYTVLVATGVGVVVVVCCTVEVDVKKVDVYIY